MFIHLEDDELLPFLFNQIDARFHVQEVMNKYDSILTGTERRELAKQILVSRRVQFKISEYLEK